MWRAEDDALLRRLDDAERTAALWSFESRAAPPLHPRAAGMLEALREQDPHLDLDDVEALGAALRPPSLRGFSAELLHHLAVYEARLAAALLEGGHHRDALDASLRELAAWLALAEEHDYLAGLGVAHMADGGAEAALKAWRRTMQALGVEARRDAADLGPGGALALEALARANDACGRADCSSERRAEVDRLAERLRAEAMEDALAGVGHAADDALARDVVPREGPPLAARLANVWRWSGHDEHVERFAVDVITPLAWRAYKDAMGWTPLEAMLAPLRPLIDSLRMRVASDPRRIAYAAPVAQMYVFYTEIAPFEGKAEPARLGLELCPDHRNARVVMASYHVGLVRRRLGRGFVTRNDREELRKKLAYVRELHPHYEGLEGLEREVG